MVFEKRWGPTCARLEFSGCRVKPWRLWGPWGFKHHQNSTRRHPERHKKNEIVAGEGKKRAKFGEVRRRGPAEGGPAEGGLAQGGPGEAQTNNNHNNHNHNNTNTARKEGGGQTQNKWVPFWVGSEWSLVFGGLGCWGSVNLAKTLKH